MKKSAGFTLIECLLTLSLFSIVVSLIMNLFLTSYKMYRHTEYQVEVEESIRIPLSRIAECVRQIDNPHDRISVKDNILQVGDRKYSLQGNIVYESNNGIKNQLALNIASFQPVIKDNTLILDIEGIAFKDSPRLKAQLVLHLGVNP